LAKIYHQLADEFGQTQFTGYNTLKGEAVVKAIIKNYERAEQADEDVPCEIVLNTTPFYGESGGQVGDTGELHFDGGTFYVTDTVKPAHGLWVHKGYLKGLPLKPGQKVTAEVDAERRKAIARHHLATHLLHYAIRKVLGSHATQKGSRVAHDGFRFDFAHFEPLTANQIEKIQTIVGTRIVENHPVKTTLTTFDRAQKDGATALFEETYGDEVRLVEIGNFSRELCGGTHVSSSGELGPFYILSQSGVAAGVRRIEAICGIAAVKWYQKHKNAVDSACAALKTTWQNLGHRIEKMQVAEKEKIKQIEK
jgi:alanyl-tRNA synthetase